MKRHGYLPAIFLLFVVGAAAGQPRSYVGFDRNTYPGNAELRALSVRFAFTGYWLNHPPGATANSWTGHRKDVRRAGMGFLVLWNGRTFRELGGQAAELGRRDGEAAVAAARQEGFRKKTVIFLDQEEGGRLLPAQREYLHAWVDGVTAAGFRAGVYCSGIEYREGSGSTVVTAEDIRANAAGRQIVYWVANDACPPSPGCVAETRITAGESGVKFAEVWQYAQSPVRKGLTAACQATYDPTTNCYAPGTKIDMDLSVAGSRDPSRGR